jgi:hypothetical protein
MAKEKKDYLSLKFSFEIDGKLKGKKIFKHIIGTSKEPIAFTLEDVARQYAIGESIANVSGTSLDYVLDDCKEFFGASDEDVKVLMDKYWHKKQVTFKELIDSYKPFVKEDTAESALVQDAMHRLIDKFSRAPFEIKRGLIYTVFKHFNDSDMANMQKDIDNTPQYLKDIIDEKIFKLPDSGIKEYKPVNPIAERFNRLDFRTLKPNQLKQLQDYYLAILEVIKD